MRTVLNHTILSTVLVLMASVLGLSSCQREVPTADAQSGDVLVSFTVNTPAVAETTKSVITGDYFETGIRSILILIAGEDGSYKKVYKEATSGFLSTGVGGAVLQLDGVNLKAKYQRYDIYAFVNMGDVLSSIPKDASGKLNPASFAYRLPDAYADLGTRGMPMCAQASLEANELGTGGETRVRLTLRRLMAKVVISVNKTGMTGENAGVLNSSIIRVRQVPRVIRPFVAGGSGALEVAELYGGVGASSTDTDYYSFSAGAGDVAHTNVTTLYVPENYQGIGSETSQEKKATAPGETPTGRQALATFLEYTASKSGTNDGVSGNLTYKAYLGENVVDDYNVIGDKVYRATLNLSWNGLFYTGDWRVDNSDITDGRLLTLSETPHTTSSSFTDWGRLRRNVASQLYVNFSRDGGSTWVHSAKDIDGWPYGWDLWVDGVKQGSGASGTATGDLGWAYTGAAAGDRLGITPGPSSVASSVHTLQVKSADGRVVSNEVSFQVSQPLNFFWPYGNGSYYVAQRPLLVQNTGLDDSSATITYAEKNGSPNVEIEQMSKTSMYLNLLAAGEYTIVATASNGQTGEVTFTVQDPVIEQLWTSQELWVDGKASDQMLSKYKTTDGTEMSVSDADNHFGNTWFAPSLYERVLRPRVASLSAVSGYAFNSKVENVIAFEDNTLYVNTLRCTTTGNEFAVEGYLGRHFKVNVQAGAETFSFETFFRDPFQDVTNTSFSETFHDFTSMYAHISSTMKNTYGQSKNHSLGSGTGKMLYADASNVLIQASQTIDTRRTALTGTYTNGSGYIAIGLGAEGQYHPSGVNDVYIHVQNKYDKAAGGDRAAYCLSKKIGTATIYLHVAWATIVKPKSYHGEYDIKVTNGPYQKDHQDDRWDMRYLCGGFLGQHDVEWNNEVGKLAGSDFYTMKLSSNTGFYYYMGQYTLTDKYGFVANRFARNSADVAYGLGFAIMKTFSGNHHDTFTWNEWRSSHYTSPFCSYRAAFGNWTGTGSWNGLTGYYYVSDKEKDILKDSNGNGYVVAHFLQDLPVNPNNGYVE